MISRILRTLAPATLVLGAASAASAQANFSRYLAIGDSLSAGFTSGALVETQQINSFPALLARQAGLSDFQQPLVTEPGIPPQLALVTLLPVPTIAPKAATPGTPKNLDLARPYNNLAVPGATAADALSRRSDGGGFHDLILRGLGSQVEQAVAFRPSLVTLWIGSNDVLGAALRGTAIDGVTLTPTGAFRQTYGQIVQALRSTGTAIVAANIPDPTSIPFVTTIKPYVVNPSTGEPVLINGNRVPLLGPSGPLPPDAYVTLPASSLLAQGVGIPTALGGTGQPLPGEVVLDAGEVSVIRDHVNQNNQAIQELCQAASIPVFDARSLLDQIAREGYGVGGIALGTEFLSGGIFGYDGVHPGAVGYAIVANEWIRLINESSGSSLPVVDLGPFLGVTASQAAAAGARSAGSPRPAPPAFEFSAEAYAQLLRAFPRLDER